MSKTKTFRACLFALPALFLFGCNLTGNASSKGEIQGTAPVSNSEAGGGKGGAGGNVDSTVESVPYGIFIGATVSGECGVYSNSTGFENMEFGSEFHGIVFMRPMGKGVPGPYGGLRRQEDPAGFTMPGAYVSGKGDIQKVSFCPEYETEDVSYPVEVKGIHPFEPSIAIVPADQPRFPAVTEIPDTPTMPGGGKAVIMFSMGGTESGDPIIECEVRGADCSFGGLGDSNLMPFVTTWDQLMKGEEFAFEFVVDEDGETWHWSIRFMPEPAME
jgi:hypothetical protein